jgi:hypothetical protein
MPAEILKRYLRRIAGSRLLLFLLIVEGLVWLSERVGWFGPKLQKGSSVPIAMATIGFAIVVIFLWTFCTLIVRRRLGFSLRRLLLLLLVFAFPFSWMAIDIQSAVKQHAVVKSVKDIGGAIRYDFEPPAGFATSSTPPGPWWIRKLLGVDLFADVTGIDLTRSTINDIGLHDLEGLTQLKDLKLGYTAVSDAGLEHLRGLNQLQSLGLNGTRVSDAGLQYLEGLKQLRALNLDETNITDLGLQDLRGLKQLRTLYLNRTAINDIGLKSLEGLPRLQDLFLNRTAVSDMGLEYLKGLPKLHLLFAQGTNVTAAGVEKLKQALPNCDIRYTESMREAAKAPEINDSDDGAVLILDPKAVVCFRQAWNFSDAAEKKRRRKGDILLCYFHRDASQSGKGDILLYWGRKRGGKGDILLYWSTPAVLRKCWDASRWTKKGRRKGDILNYRRK